MILLVCFLTILGLGRCQDQQLPSRLEIESSINRTIEEVERMIKGDPNLPRLSRSQIVDILQNITSKDVERFEESVEQMRSNYQRALTVVLPYNSKDAQGENLEDLYTRPPMIQIIPDSETMLPFASIQEEPLPSQPYSKSPKSSEEMKNAPEPNASPNAYKNHRSEYSEINYDSSPEKFSFEIYDYDPIKPKQPPSKSSFSKAKKTTQKPKLEVIYSSSVTENPTTARSTITTTPPSDNVVSTTVPTTRSTVNILTSDQWRYNAPPSPTTPRPITHSTTTTIRTTTDKYPTVAYQAKKPVKPFVPTVMSSASDTTTVFKKLPETTSKAPEVITIDLAEMMMNDGPTAAFYVTPMSSTTTDSIKPTSEPIKTPPPMREEVATLLASIGLQPKPEEIHEKPVESESEGTIFEEDFAIPESDNIILNQINGLTANGADSPSIANQNTFENPYANLQKNVMNLSPDMQLLFQRFGLPVSGQKSKEPTTTTTTTPKPKPTVSRIVGNTWNSFKPLPTTEVKDEKMRDFLATFGLGVPDNRDKKSMNTASTTEEPSVIEAVPNNMKDILANIGLISRVKATKAPTEAPLKYHIFKPHESLISDEKQKNKINDLLDTVKLVHDGKADISEVQKAANQLLRNVKKLQSGPDPVSLEEILKMYNEEMKNEVKRQESKDNLNDMATSDAGDNEMSASDMSESSMNMTDTTSNDSATASSSDSDSRNSNIDVVTTPAVSSTVASNLDDLADSFGGTTAEPDPVLPTPRRSGLYFLVDWNSFLEVGEEDKDKVNLRFSPKAGDRTRFIPVVIP